MNFDESDVMIAILYFILRANFKANPSFAFIFLTNFPSGKIYNPPLVKTPSTSKIKLESVNRDLIKLARFKKIEILKI